MDGGEEVSSELVIAGGDGAVLLELAEEVFDQMARLVEFLVVRPGRRAIALGRDHRDFVGGGEGLDHPGIGVERLVSEQGVGGEVRQEGIGPLQVVRLPGGKQELDGVAECVDDGVDLGAQPTFAAADRLVFAVFFWAPALC